MFRSDSRSEGSNRSECSSHSQSQNNYDIFTDHQLSRSQQNLGNREIQNLITSHLEASKIGRHIADTVLDVKKKSCEIDSSSSQLDILTEVVAIDM